MPSLHRISGNFYLDPASEELVVMMTAPLKRVQMFGYRLIIDSKIGLRCLGIPVGLFFELELSASHSMTAKLVPI